ERIDFGREVIIIEAHRGEKHDAPVDEADLVLHEQTAERVVRVWERARGKGFAERRDRAVAQTLLAQLRIVAAIGNAVLRSARAERRDELRLQAEHVVLENRETRAVGGSVAIFRAELLGLAG